MSKKSLSSKQPKVRISNTHPSNEHKLFDLKKLPKSRLQGIDTLKLNIKAPLPKDLLESFSYLLEDKKLQSEDSTETPQPIQLDLIFNNEPLYLLPYSSKGWTYLLKNDWINIAIGRGGITEVYARLTLSSEYLWSGDYSEILNYTQSWVFDLLGKESICQVSEVHLCNDVEFVDFSDIHAWLQFEEALVTRADKRIPVIKHGKIETIEIGSRNSAISAVIYNKSREIKHHSGKVWFFDLWRQNGYEETTVWRLEFRVNREALREFKVETIYDLLESLDSLWDYLTGKWLRHTKSSESDRYRQKAKTSLLWKAFQNIPDKEYKYDPSLREKQREYQVEKLAQQIVGCTMSSLALLGYKIANLYAVRKELDEMFDYKTKKLGFNINELLQQKRTKLMIA